MQPEKTAHYDGSEKREFYNKKPNYEHRFEGSYSPGIFEVKKTYIGKTEDRFPYPDAVNGETVALRAEWSNPPEVLIPDEKLTLTVELSCVENSASRYNSSAYVGAKLSNYNLDHSGDGSVKINVKTNYATVNETYSITIPKGDAIGEELKLKVFMSSQIGMQTVYVYKWEAAK